MERTLVTSSPPGGGARSEDSLSRFIPSYVFRRPLLVSLTTTSEHRSPITRSLCRAIVLQQAPAVQTFLGYLNTVSP